MSTSTRSIGARQPTFTETVLHPFVERRTYLALAYALLGLPLGIFYFVFVVTGLSLGLGLLVTLLGVPVLALTLAGCRGLAQLERSLTASLLDAAMPRVDTGREQGSIWQKLGFLVRSGSTWRELAYLLLRFPAGIASFSIAVTAVSGGVYYGLVHPFLVGFGLHTELPGGREIDTVPEALLLVPPGLILLLLAPAILNVLGRLERSLAVFFLARIPRSDFRRAIARSLDRGDADAFSLMTDLEIYFGPGPYLSAARLEASLLALVDLGLVAKTRSDSRDIYSLTDKGREAYAASS